MRRFFALLIVVIAIACATAAAAMAETYQLRGRVSDVEGRPMEGGKLFIYDSSSVRRPADFISPLSNGAGLTQIVLPSGKYWVIARFKSDGKYGPLMPGDKHSGEPLEVDLTAGNIEVDFVVADIRELGQKKRASATDALRLKGRIVDGHGVPVAQAFVFACIAKECRDLPDFISAWTGSDGRYELYLPPGAAYYAGVSRQFPPSNIEPGAKLKAIENGKIDIAIDIDLTVE